MTPGPPGQDKSGRLETVKNTKKVRIMIRLILVAVTLIGFLTLGYPLLAAQNSLGKKDPQLARQAVDLLHGSLGIKSPTGYLSHHCSEYS